MGARLKNITVEKWTALGLFVFLAILPMTASLYTTQTYGRFISYMILALALDLLWGGAGLMNLGFAVFFGLGGYIVGISLASQEEIPYFMQSAGLTELPFFYKPLESPALAVVLSIVVPALLALFLGYFIFTSKIKGVFFNIITLAFAALFELFITNQQAYTGGSSGINGIADGLSDLAFFGHSISIQGWYYIALTALILIYLFCLWLSKGRFGKVINSVRDNEARLQFLGYNPAKFKMAVFAISGAIAGFAGALYIPMTSFISVDSAGVTFSTTILVWLAVGGRGNLTGAMIGTLLVNILSSQFSSNFGEMWQLILGVVLVAMVLFLPRGIMGSLMDIQYSRRIHKKQMSQSRKE
ncbi:MAG: urea ABC transporter permease subunit UrtC [Ruminococcus sp.]|jgi:urea transport system permease protein